jgi:hypothetical protein
MNEEIVPISSAFWLQPGVDCLQCPISLVYPRESDNLLRPFLFLSSILLSLSCLFCLPFCCILSSSPSVSHPPIFVPRHFFLFIHLVDLNLAFPLFSADASLSLSVTFSFCLSLCPLIWPIACGDFHSRGQLCLDHLACL